MKTSTRLGSILVTALVLACLTSCRDSTSIPTIPSRPAPPSNVPLLLNLVVSGPTTVHIGEAVRFTATAKYTDGSERDVTGEAKWQVGSEHLSLTGPGEVIGRSAGESSVTAAFSTGSSVIAGVIIVPPGTYHLRGTVRDAGKPLHDANVVVTSPPLGTTTVSLVNGVYRVYGVAGPTTVTVSKEGYRTETRESMVTEHQTLDIDVVLTQSRPDISGAYTLTLTASTECSSLPAYALRREYRATVTQSGGDLEVVLTPPAGSRFLDPYPFTLDRFRGSVAATTVHFDLSRTPPDFYQYSDSWPPIFEIITEGRYFGVDGSATAPVLSDRLEGALRGTFTTSYPWTPRPVQCPSDTHVLRLTR